MVLHRGNTESGGADRGNFARLTESVVGTNKRGKNALWTEGDGRIPAGAKTADREKKKGRQMSTSSIDWPEPPAGLCSKPDGRPFITL